MDAVKFLKESKRLCASFESCGDCPLCARYGCMIEPETEEDGEVIEVIVEKWSAEHPEKTRKSEFLKIFPHAEQTKNGCICISPCKVDVSLRTSRCNQYRLCDDCRKAYWLEEAE